MDEIIIIITQEEIDEDIKENISVLKDFNLEINEETVKPISPNQYILSKRIKKLKIHTKETNLRGNLEENRKN